MNSPKQFPNSLCIFTLFVVFALVGCGSDPEANEPRTVDEEGDGMVDQKDANGFDMSLWFLTPDVEVSKKELSCVEQEYADHVHWGKPHAHQQLTSAIIRFTEESYRKLESGFTCGEGETPGLMIRFGADSENKALSLAYGFVCMNLDDNGKGTFVEDDKLYVINEDDSLVGSTSSLSDWQAAQGKAFQDNVLVDKYDNKAFQYIYKDYRGHTIHKLSEINDLIAHNELAGTDFVEIVPIAEPRIWPKYDQGSEFTMRTCLVAVKAGSRRITDDVPPSPASRLTDRGTDLGSVCPPLCLSVTFPAHGVAIRKSCK